MGRGTSKFSACPAPILAQRLQQLRAEWKVAVATALALAHMDNHTLTIDVLGPSGALTPSGARRSNIKS